jgi:hypothetical protein
VKAKVCKWVVPRARHPPPPPLPSPALPCPPPPRPPARAWLKSLAQQAAPPHSASDHQSSDDQTLPGATRVISTESDGNDSKISV